MGLILRFTSRQKAIGRRNWFGLRCLLKVAAGTVVSGGVTTCCTSVSSAATAGRVSYYEPAVRRYQRRNKNRRARSGARRVEIER